MYKNKWFVIPKPNINAEIKLICFPYAGGSAVTYLNWAQQIADNVELIIVQPPGRGPRMFEPLHKEMTTLIAELLIHFPTLLNKPYILFGHSLGSRVAFELMAELSKLAQPLPKHFIASGSKGPHLFSDKKSLHALSDEEFIIELEQLSGTPKAVLENRELMELFLPVLRADFQIAETYRYDGSSKFPCTLSVLGGRDDIDIPREKLESWTTFFEKTTQICLLDGDHFFIDNHQEQVLKKVNCIIKETVKELGLHNTDSLTFS